MPELGDVGTALLFENERVKVWEMDLAPGQESDMHHHARDYVLVVVEGDRIAGVPPADGDPARHKESEVRPGQVFWVPAGGTELARNTGARRYYEILVELKD